MQVYDPAPGQARIGAVSVAPPLLADVAIGGVRAHLEPVVPQPDCRPKKP